LITSSTTTSTGALIVSGGVGIAENLNVGGNTVLGNAASETVTANAAVTMQSTLTVAGNTVLATRQRTRSRRGEL